MWKNNKESLSHDSPLVFVTFLLNGTKNRTPSAPASPHIRRNCLAQQVLYHEREPPVGVGLVPQDGHFERVLQPIAAHRQRLLPSEFILMLWVRSAKRCSRTNEPYVRSRCIHYFLGVSSTSVCFSARSRRRDTPAHLPCGRCLFFFPVV